MGSSKITKIYQDDRPQVLLTFGRWPSLKKDQNSDDSGNNVPHKTVCNLWLKQADVR
jgi:hypothetical protein